MPRFGEIMPRVMVDTGRFEAKKTRRYLLRRGFLPDKVVQCCYRPFDIRWLYWEPETKLLDEKRSEYAPHLFPENMWIAAVQQNRKNFDPPLVTARLSCRHVIERGANMFPAFLHLGTHDNAQPNLSRASAKYLASLARAKEVKDLFTHTVAILYSATYAQTNASALRQNWPRIPLPRSKNTLFASTQLGKGIAELLDVEAPVDSVTSGKIRSDLRTLATVAREGGGNLNPDADDLDVKVGWGHFGQGGAIMPGKGKVVTRDYSADERGAIEAGTKALGISAKDAFALLGDRTLDVYLNGSAYWKNVPLKVWEYTIGGYQVMKKWLSYREKEILKRSLKMEEVYEVRDMARRIAAILLLQPQLDANYEAVKKRHL